MLQLLRIVFRLWLLMYFKQCYFTNRLVLCIMQNLPVLIFPSGKFLLPLQSSLKYLLIHSKKVSTNLNIFEGTYYLHKGIPLKSQLI